MVVGIRSATPAVLHASVVDAARGTLPPPVSPLITGEGLTAPGTLLARPGAREAWARAGVRNQERFTAAPVSVARISADPLSVIRLSLDRVRGILVSDHLATRDSHQAHICLVAHASIPLAAIADLAAEDLAIAGAGAVTAMDRVRLGWLRLEPGLLAGILQLRLGRRLLWNGLRLGLGLWPGLAVLGQLLGAGLGLRMGPVVVVRPLLVRALAVVQLLSGLSRHRIQRSAVLRSGHFV